MRTIQQRVEIYSMTDVLLATGALVDLSDNLIEIVGEVFPHFEKGENLKICAYDDMRGICWYLTSVELATPDRLILTDYNLLDVIQRRKNIKVKTTFSTNIYMVYDDNDVRTALETPVKITVKDISVGGTYFVAEQVFLEGSYFEFYFNQGPKHLRIKTLILRMQVLPGEKLGYGCKFADITEKEQDILFSFLWEEQRLQLKRLKLE
ncbi:MAG: PilZ domain-containing protein [Acetanaerobacterium sp.]